MRGFSTAVCLLVAFSLGSLFPLRPSVFADGDNDKTAKEEPDKPKAKKLTDEEKAAKLKALKEAKKPGTLIKRAQAKIDKYCEDATNATVAKTIIFYGHDEDGGIDVKVFVEFTDGLLGIYYADVDPDCDAWMTLEKAYMEDLENIGNKQKNR
jgi:hypothetical protein